MLQLKLDNITMDLLEILENGMALKFSDGSVFQVDPFDRPEVGTWSVANVIELEKTRDSVFNYTLINRDINTWVRASKLN